MAEVGSLFVRLRADASEFEKTLSGIGGQFKNAGKGMQNVGGGLTKAVTAPLVGIAGAGLAVFQGYESGMNRVEALTGATGGALEDLDKTAKHLGATTSFSAKQAADGMGFLAMAGFDATQIIEAMPNVLQLAAAAQLDLGTAADITSNILTGYGKDTSELAGVNDVLVKAFTNSNTDLGMLGESMKYVGPVASSAGMEFEEVAAAVGLLGNAGIQGSMAGTSLRNVISRLLKPTDEAAGVMDRLGINALDSEGNLRPLNEIVQQLEDSGASTSDMMTIFGQRAGPAMAALVQQGAGSLRDFRDDLRDSGGIADQVASTQLQGVTGAMVRLKSATEGAFIAIGETLAPAMIILAGLLTRVAEFIINRVMPAFQGLSPTMQTIILVVAGIVAAIGPLLVIFGTLLVAVGAVVANFGIVIAVVGALTSPIALVVLAIAGLVAAFVIAYKTSETFRNIVHGALDAVRTVAETVFNGILSLAQTVWPSIQTAIETATGAVKSVTETVWPIVQAVVETVFGAVRDLANEVWPEIEQIIGTVSEIVSTLVETFFGDIQTVIERVSGVIQATAEAVWPLMQAIIEGVMGAIQAVVEAVMGVVQFVWDSVSNHLLAHARVVWDSIKGVIDGVMNIIAGILETVMGVISGDWGRAWDGIKQALSGVWTIIKSVVRLAISSVRTIARSGMGLVTGVFEKAWGGIKTFISDRLDDIEQFMKDLPGRILKAVGDLSKLLFDVGKDIIGGLKDGITDMIPSVDDVLGGITDKIPDWKGPLSKDRKLLQPTGLVIMEGLESGIASGAADVQRRLERLTGDLGGMSGGNAGETAGARYVTIPINIGGREAERWVIDTVNGHASRSY